MTTGSGGATTPVLGSNGQSSIQILLDAEKEASAQVNAARQYRVQRLKDARSEAEAEIEALKAAKKQEYEQFDRSISSGMEDSLKEQESKTLAELEKTQKSAEQNREAVLKLLIEKVLAVEPVLHPNALAKKKTGERL